MVLLYSVNGVPTSDMQIAKEPKKIKSPSEWIGTIKPEAHPNDHIFNKINDGILAERHHTPNRQRVAPGKVAEYDLAKQKAVTYDRLDQVYSAAVNHGLLDRHQIKEANSDISSFRASKNKNIAKAEALLPQH